MNYYLNIIILFEIYVIVAISLNLLLGYGGLLQIAHASYFGVGAYVLALLTTKLGMSFLLALFFSVSCGGILSLLVSIPACRFKGDYWVMISFAVQVVLFSIMINWNKVTNGLSGIANIPTPIVFNVHIDTLTGIAATYGIILATLGIVAYLLKKGPFGRGLEAMRDDEVAAQSIGIQVRKLKIEVFFIASGFVAVAGGMYAGYMSFIEPSSFSLNESILMLSMIIVGGTGNFIGPIVGAGLLIAIPEALRFLPFSASYSDNLRLLAYGLLLIIMMHLRPQGVAGKYRYE